MIKRKEKIDKDDDIWRFTSSRLRFIALIPITLLVSSMISDWYNHSQMRRLVSLDYSTVDTIVIDDSNQVCSIADGEGYFDEIQMLLYPFHNGTISPHARDIRTLQRQSERQFAEIVFYNGNSYLISLTIRLYEEHPFPEVDGDRDVFARSVFTVDGYYALAFINGSNHLANFSFDSWDDVRQMQGC